MTVCAMQIVNWLTLCRIALNDGAGNFLALVGRIVQHLNLKPIAWILQRATGVNQSIDHELLVKNWQLHRNEGKLSIWIGNRRLRRVFAIPVVKPPQVVAVNAVKREPNHPEEIRCQEQPVKPVSTIKPAEGRVSVVG